MTDDDANATPRLIPTTRGAATLLVEAPSEAIDLAISAPTPITAALASASMAGTTSLDSHSGRDRRGPGGGPLIVTKEQPASAVRTARRWGIGRSLR